MTRTVQAGGVRGAAWRGIGVVLGLGLGVAIGGVLAGCPSEDSSQRTEAAAEDGQARPSLVGRWAVDREATEALFVGAFSDPAFEPTEAMEDFFEGDREAMAQTFLAFLRVEYVFEDGGGFRVEPLDEGAEDLRGRGTWRATDEGAVIDEGGRQTRAVFEGQTLRLIETSDERGVPREISIALVKLGGASGDSPEEGRVTRTTIDGRWVLDGERTRGVLVRGYESAAAAGSLSERLQREFAGDAGAFAAREIERYGGITFAFERDAPSGMTDPTGMAGDSARGARSGTWRLRVPPRGEYPSETETGVWVERDGSYVLDEGSRKENRAEVRAGELWVMPVVQAERYYPGYAFVFRAVE